MFGCERFVKSSASAQTMASIRDNIALLIVTLSAVSASYDPEIKHTRKDFIPAIPPSCEYDSFCEEEIPNYPHEHVKDILSRINEGSSYRLAVPAISSHREPPEQNIDLCRFIKKIIHPTAARNSRGDWVFVVNKKDEPLQEFLTETCVKQHKQCGAAVIFQEHYNATCFQKEVETNIWTIDHDGNMVSTTFLLPTCCTCMAWKLPE